MRKHAELIHNGGWRQRTVLDGPLDLMDENLEGIKLGEWPAEIHEQSTHIINSYAFFRASFVRTRLSKSVLRCIYFAKADFQSAQLDQVRIEGCSFDEAIFRKTDLRGSVFALRSLRVVDPPDDEWETEKTVSLRSATLDNVLVEGADFSGAEFNHTVIVDTDLSKATGLELARHSGSSIISQSTFALSQGLIPKAFLQGIGLQDWEIEAVQLYKTGLSNVDRAEIVARALKLAEPATFYSVFISYSHADKKFANQLYKGLQARGVRCWLDEHQLLPGDDILEEVTKGIKVWDKVLLCCSEASLTSWWVDHEIDAAFEKEQRLMRERGTKILALIPLDLDGYLDRWKTGKATQVRSRFAANFRGWHRSEKFKSSLDQIVQALQLGDGEREAPPAPRL